MGLIWQIRDADIHNAFSSPTTPLTIRTKHVTVGAELFLCTSVDTVPNYQCVWNTNSITPAFSATRGGSHTLPVASGVNYHMSTQSWKDVHTHWCSKSGSMNRLSYQTIDTLFKLLIINWYRTLCSSLFSLISSSFIHQFVQRTCNLFSNRYL